MVDWIKKVLLVLGIAFVVFYLFTRPEAVAEVIRTFFDAFESIARFFSHLAGQPAVRLFACLLEPDIQRHLLVEEDERVIDEVRKYWVVSPLWIGVMFLSIPTFVLVIAARRFFQIPMLVGLYLLGFEFWKAYIAHMDRFVMANMRAFWIHGMFNTRLATTPMTRILDTSLEQPMPGKIFDYGHLVFESAAQAQGLWGTRCVARPAGRDLTIQRVIQRLGLRKKMVMEDEDETDGV